MKVENVLMLMIAFGGLIATILIGVFQLILQARK